MYTRTTVAAHAGYSRVPGTSCAERIAYGKIDPAPIGEAMNPADRLPVSSPARPWLAVERASAPNFVALALAAALLGACTPPVSTVVIARSDTDSVLVRTNDQLSPGDVVFLWHRYCAPYWRRCGRRLVARGIVTTVLVDSSGYAFVEVPPGTDLVEGDRAVKESPISPWHIDPPGD